MPAHADRVLPAGPLQACHELGVPKCEAPRVIVGDSGVVIGLSLGA